AQPAASQLPRDLFAAEAQLFARGLLRLFVQPKPALSSKRPPAKLSRRGVGRHDAVEVAVEQGALAGFAVQVGGGIVRDLSQRRRKIEASPPIQPSEVAV